MTLKIRILRCSRRLFVILASLMVTSFSEKLLIFNRAYVVSCPTLSKNLWRSLLWLTSALVYIGFLSPRLSLMFNLHYQSYPTAHVLSRAAHNFACFGDNWRLSKWGKSWPRLSLGIYGLPEIASLCGLWGNFHATMHF